MAFHARDRDSVLFMHRRIHTPLAVGGEVAVFQLVAGEALVASGVHRGRRCLLLFKDGNRNRPHWHRSRGEKVGSSSVQLGLGSWSVGLLENVNQSPTQSKPQNTLPPFRTAESLVFVWGPYVPSPVFSTISGDTGRVSSSDF